jgi:conjugal transfer pilus assembly protein TraU
MINASSDCPGKFINPITDICWKCVFPIRIAGVKVAKGGPDPDSTPKRPICFCKGKTPPVPVPGIPVSFWEPVRLVDVVRKPFCLVNMGGMYLKGTSYNRGDREENSKKQLNTSFYHVHWYVYPILYWLEVLIDFICLENMSIDLAYLTEFDPLWNDDAKTAILNPEVFLFANPIAQMACLADCAAASANLPLDPLFWCGGCQGSMYPLTGNVGAATSCLQSSLLISQRFMFKLHRQLMLWGYMGKEGQCRKYPMPIMEKSQYRLQLTYPVSEKCHPLGSSETLWQSGKEYPYKGSDFGYLVWRKRDCCLTPIPIKRD